LKLNIWFLLWIFVACFILGTSFWSLSILARQKKSWEIVSKNNHLQYSSAAVFKSPVIRGNFNSVPIEIFSDVQISGGARDKSQRTIIQMTLKGPMLCEGAIASMPFKHFIDGLQLPDTLSDDASLGIIKEIYIRLQNREVIKPYFTKERVQALNALLNIKNMPALIIFGSRDTVLRIESADPFDNPERFQKFLTKATEAAKIISI